MINNSGTNGDSISRQVQRKNLRNERKQQDQTRKYLNSSVPRNEFIPLIQQVQQLQNMIATIELMVTSLQRMLINKGVATEDEINAAIKFEQERARKWKEIQESKEPYDKRLDLCKEWEIAARDTNIPIQIKDDNTLDIKGKLALAEKFDIPAELVGVTVQTPIPDDKPDS